METHEPQGLGLTFHPYSIQIEPHDYWPSWTTPSRAQHHIDRPVPRHLGVMSLRPLQAEAKEGEIGFHTMPHKVNPIKFENPEG